MNMKNLHYIVLLVLPFLFQSCLRDDKDVFGTSTADRLATALKQDQEILMGAANGWLMSYYPGKSQSYGGYNLLIKFSKNDQVTVSSELSKADKTETSMYQLIGDSGPVLTFNTYNSLIHYFSEPWNSDGIGPVDTGMGGDYEFIILEATPEKVTLKGKKTGNRIIMTPIPTTTSWSDYLTILQKSNDNIYFPKYKCSIGGVDVDVSLSQHNFTLQYTENEKIIKKSMPFIATPTGFKLYETLELGNASINEFTYKSSDNSFISDDNKGQLTGIILPLNQLLLSGSWYLTYSKLGTYGQQCWDVVKAALLTKKEKLYFVTLTDGYFTFASILIDGIIPIRGIINLTNETEGDNKISLYFNGKANTIGYYYLTQVEGFDSILRPLTGKFTLTADNAKKPSWIKLSNENNPENTITLSRSEVYYPDEK